MQYSICNLDPKVKHNNWYSLWVTKLRKWWVTWSTSKPGPFTPTGFQYSLTLHIKEIRTRTTPVKRGEHYHGKLRLQMVLGSHQTSSSCELPCNAERKGQMQSSADLRQRAGDIVHGTGAWTLNSKMNTFTRYWKIWRDVERRDKNNSWAGRNPLQWKI